MQLATAGGRTPLRFLKHGQEDLQTIMIRCDEGGLHQQPTFQEADRLEPQRRRQEARVVQQVEATEE